MDDIELDGQKLVLPRAVYLRSTYGHALSYGLDASEAMAADWRATLVALSEKQTLLVALCARWEALSVPFYNALSAEWRTTKPYQLALLERAGLPVPRTLWTNDPAAVRRFANGQRIAYKPVSGGAATRELAADDLSDERLAALSAAPVTFQELMPGEDVRVYVLDDRVIASIRIETDALDFRQNERALVSIALPSAVEQQCIRAARLLGLRFTGIDLKADPHGQLRFLELNSSPMFLGFDERAGTDVLGQLAQALVTAAA